MSKNTPNEDKEPLTPKCAGEPDDDISQYYPDGDYESMEDDDETYQALLKKKQKTLFLPEFSMVILHPTMLSALESVTLERSI